MEVDAPHARNAKRGGFKNAGSEHDSKVCVAFAERLNGGFAVQIPSRDERHAVLPRQFHQRETFFRECLPEKLAYLGPRNRRAIHGIVGGGGNRFDDPQEWIRPSVRPNVANQISPPLREKAASRYRVTRRPAPGLSTGKLLQCFPSSRGYRCLQEMRLSVTGSLRCLRHSCTSSDCLAILTGAFTILSRPRTNPVHCRGWCPPTRLCYCPQ